ncbi:MAG: phosphohistidine phosphatase SixA [Chthoniobacterales bacterium]|nr:phosphohistidine phosphatase SixA [Chthoniobacterales bacterium]
MQLFFLRHGKADWPDWQKPDDERPLTKPGRKEVRAVAQFLVRLKARPDLILTSPLPRAVQTAEIAAEHLETLCVEERLLGPGFGLPELVRLQKKYAERSLMLVGHEPDFSGTIAALMNGRIKLAKAGVAMVELDAPDRGRLRWLFPPRVVRA